MRLLIDGNNLAWQSYHALPELSFDRKRTEVAFGFLYRVISLAEKFKTDRFAFFWDSDSWRRKELYAGYKSNREGSKPEDPGVHIARQQIKKLREDIITSMGFKNNFWIDGYEADDLIAYIAKGKREESYIIVSTDNDLLQLLDHNVRIYDTRKRVIIDLPWLFDNKKVTQSQWAEVKALAGCQSDAVPGISGVGEVTAIKYVRGEKIGEKVKSKIHCSQKTLELTRRLVRLPFGGMDNKDYGKVLKLREDEFDRRDFLTTFDRYRFISFFKNFKKWDGIFFKKRRIYKINWRRS